MNETIVPILDKVFSNKYFRCAFAKKGTIIVGCEHNISGEAFLLSGSIRQNNEDGTFEDYTAPYHIKTNSGTQRVAYTLEDTIYCTIHSLEYATNTDEAEVEIFKQVPQITRIRNDYKLLLNQLNMDKEPEMQDCVFEHNDNIYFNKSEIHGIGCFSNRDIMAGEVIAVELVDSIRLSDSRYVNHSDIPNSEFVDTEYNSTCLVSLCDIPKDSEIFVNYRRRLLCQE